MTKKKLTCACANPCNRLSVNITVNKQPLPLNNFVQEFIGQAILGMLKGLKGASPAPKDINIRIKHKG